MPALFIALALAGAGGARAAPAKAGRPPAVSDAGLAEIDRAINEQRYVDASHMLDQAALAGMQDPRLTLLAARLDLCRGRYTDALAEFKAASASPLTSAGAQEGVGIALSLMGRPSEAMVALKLAVVASPGAWRAWNALGSEYDERRDFTAAEAAYAKALQISNNDAIVLNNRGFSRLLQRRTDEAVSDLAQALQKRPDLAEARVNLRLALAMKGDYARAATGAPEDRAMLYNNAGFGAALRGDYATAEQLLNEAIKARSVRYDRASENLSVVRSLAGDKVAQDKSAQALPDKTHGAN